jgi:copper transport protein
VKKLTVTAILAALLSLGLWAAASAHAEPAKVTPGDGAVLNTPPSQVEITMSQEMARSGGQNDIDVFDASGKEVTAVAAVIDNGDRRKLSVPLPSNLSPGTYTVRWKTLSADDGDAANGTLTFTYDPAQTPSPGRQDLRPDLLGNATVETGSTSPPAAFGGGGGTSWVLVAAVGVATFVLGSGGTFLLIQKRP